MTDQPRFQTLRFEAANGIGRLTLNGPERRLGTPTSQVILGADESQAGWAFT